MQIRSCHFSWPRTPSGFPGPPMAGDPLLLQPLPLASVCSRMGHFLEHTPHLFWAPHPCCLPGSALSAPPSCWPFPSQTTPRPSGGGHPVTLSFMTLFTSSPLSGFSGVFFIVCLPSWKGGRPGPGRVWVTAARLGEDVLMGAWLNPWLVTVLQAHLQQQYWRQRSAWEGADLDRSGSRLPPVPAPVPPDHSAGQGQVPPPHAEGGDPTPGSSPSFHRM